LRLVREKAEIRRQDQSFYPFHVVGNPQQQQDNWSFIAYGAPGEAALAEYLDGYSRDTADNGSKSRDISRSPPRPAMLSLVGISNFNGQSSDAALRSKGYTIFGDDIASLHPQPPTTNFSPFEDTDAPAVSSNNHTHAVSSSLIPTGLMDNSSESFSRSFQSENDVYLDKDWRGLRGSVMMMHAQQQQPADNSCMSMTTATASPLSMTGSLVHEHDLFEVRQPNYMRSESMNMQRATMPAPNRTLSDPVDNVPEEGPVEVDKAGRRRWFSSSLKEKPRKGLNPDAKVFRLTKMPNDFGSIRNSGAPPTFDALNPNGLGSRMISTPSSNTSSLLRAFAPSPAERQVLQRALGGSTNPSLERLPSLSRVSSIPTSPSRVHGVSSSAPSSSAGHTRPTSLHMERSEIGRTLPSWLQALPRIGKSNFSPWDDDEPVGGNGGNGLSH